MTLLKRCLIIAIGSKANYYNIPGMREHSFVLQTLSDVNKIYESISYVCGISTSEKDENIRIENLRFAIGWLALPFFKKVTFVGFLGRLLKTAIREKHIFLLRKESRNWITY